MSSFKITDVVAAALAELPAQFRNSANLRALLSLLVRPLQELEDDGCSVLEDMLVSNAEGVNLEIYGEITGVARDGRSDDDYRALILTKIGSDNSSGTPNSILDFISVLAFGATVKYLHVPPACYQLTITPPASKSPLTAAQKAEIISALFDLTPAGVCFFAIETPPEDIFTFDVGPGFDDGALAGSIGGS